MLSSPVSFWRPLLSVCTLGRTTILNKKQPDKKKKEDILIKPNVKNGARTPLENIWLHQVISGVMWDEPLPGSALR